MPDWLIALVSAGSFGVAIRTGRGLMQGFEWQKLRFLTALRRFDVLCASGLSTAICAAQT
ncbi:hypothetical protein AGR1B_Cc110011 [Agrobacterium fabacearum S56]|nr:hypothetical protein AGR1B_Cc110011 [Agrobacterium fabacearum S56]CUW88059.1 hypothetical protein AGR1C_Cc11049 [Agrobacterium fabacearum TT111]